MIEAGVKVMFTMLTVPGAADVALLDPLLFEHEINIVENKKVQLTTLEILPFIIAM